MKTLPVFLLFVGVLFGSAASAGDSWLPEDDTIFWQEVRLMLRGAIVRDGRPRDIELYLGTIKEASGKSKWRNYVLGFAGGTGIGRSPIPKARMLNNMDHEGVLKSVEDSGADIKLAIDMTINPDPWVPGGEAQYEIAVKRGELGLEGTFTGKFGDKPVKGPVTGTIREDLWPSPVEGHVPLKRGEHPRMIFRKHDLPKLMERMETAEGDGILRQLKRILGGGESMPKFRRGHKRGRDGAADSIPYTLWHGMGFGFLYQLTDQREYAELAKQCVELARSGWANVDSRYSYANPNGKLRAGSSYAAIAMAYDLCYEAWDKDYREMLAAEIQKKILNPALKPEKGAKSGKKGGPWDLTLHTGGGQHDPASNHHGAWNGGGGAAIIGILGDPGTDDKITLRAYRILRQRAKRVLDMGYGDKAYFFEGHHCGRLSTNTGLSSHLQALRVAMGEDFITNESAARWLVTKWVYELGRSTAGLINMQHGMYASFHFGRGGMSSGGDFSQGFGICPKEDAPAILYLFNKVVEPDPEKRQYDAINYPHRAVYAYVNWPVGVEPKHPGDVVGYVMIDNKARHTMFRNAWGTPNDVILSRGTLLYRGVKMGFSSPGLKEQTFAYRDKDGTVIVGMTDRSMAVDLSGKSGAEVLVIGARGHRKMDVGKIAGDQTKDAGKKAELMALLKHVSQKKANVPEQIPFGKCTRVELESCVFSLMPLPKGDPLKVSMVGEGKDASLRIGKRIIGFDGEKITLRDVAD